MPRYYARCLWLISDSSEYSSHYNDKKSKFLTFNDPQRPSLIVVSAGRNRSLHGVVDIIGHLQDTQIRLKTSCVILQDSRGNPLPRNVVGYYNLKVYDAFKWGIRCGDEVLSFIEEGGRLRATQT